MINHARTLLLNQHPDSVGVDDVGYEYIPPGFKPQKLPTALDTVHKILFGSRPDNYFLNFRAYELLSYIHQTELDTFLRALDPRITYWRKTATDFYGPAKKVFVEQIVGAPARLSIAGTAFASDAIGRSEYTYTAVFGKKAVGSPNEKTILVAKPDTSELSSKDVSGITPVLTLPNTQLNARVDSATVYERLITEIGDIFVVENYSAATNGELLLERPAGMNILSMLSADDLIDTVTAAWRVNVLTNPTSALITTLPNLEFLGEPLYLELFGVKPAEPYATFLNLWETHPLPAYKLSGIVLALIYRLNELSRK
jgi:hypothetical protein